MSFSIRAVTSIIACAVLSGCAADDLMVKRQTEAEAKIEHLIQSGRMAEQRQNVFSAQLSGQEDRYRSVANQIKQLQDSVRELQDSQELLKLRSALASQQAATPKVEVVNPAPKSGKDTGPPADYLKAFGLYSANNFTAAIESFGAFIKSSPQSDYVANAHYWIGECYYSLSELPKAKDVFTMVASTYPNSPKAPDALLKLGYTLAAMKEKENAHSVFERLIKSYPSSPSAVKARERLNAH